MKRYIWVIVLLFFSCSFAWAKDEFKDRVSLSGYLKTENAIQIQDARNDVQKLKNIVELAGQYKIKDDELVFFSRFKYWYDFAYGVRDKLDPAQHYMQHIQRNDWLRDCYLDYNNGPWFLRLGKQQVSWGQADGITILDRVNPMDLTEFYLPDMVDIRIPLWMANINYSPKLNSNIQILIIPDFEQSTGAPPDAPFAFRAYRLFNNYKTSFEAAPDSDGKAAFGQLHRRYYGILNTNIYYPEKQFENSKFGFQWSDRIAGWDYTLNYLYGYDYLARTYLDSVVVIPPAGPPFIPTAILNYSRRFKIDQLAGGSVNHTFTEEGPLEGLTLRGDFAMLINEPTYYGDPVTGASRGVDRWDNVFWLIGLDKYVITRWLVSFQFAQYIMQDAKPEVLDSSTPQPASPWQTLNSFTNGPQDQIENIFSLKISTYFLNDRLRPEVLWSFTDDNQGRIAPKLTYELRDRLWLTCGFNYFYGHEQDSNGEFRKQGQFFTNLKYSF